MIPTPLGMYYVPKPQINPWLAVILFALRSGPSRLFGVKHFAGQVFYEVVCDRAETEDGRALSVYKSMQQMNIKTDELMNTPKSLRYTVDN